MIRLHVYMLAAAMTASVATGAFALQEQPGQPKNVWKPHENGPFDPYLRG